METHSEVKRLSDFDSFLSILESSRRVVVLSGAGVSTLSGIPDFRSSGGLYSKKYGQLSVEEIVSIDFFFSHPDIFYSWASEYWFNIENFEPNIIHKCLKKMEDMGKLSEGIFTQNIDALHERAGSRNVYNLHGSLSRAFCTSCNSFFKYEDIAETVRKGDVPKCSRCGSLIKPDIVFYGEALDMSTLLRAESAFENADLALVLGSSLIVNPAASLPYISARKGKKIVIVNRDDTYLDCYACLRFRDLESFFVQLYEYLRKH